MTPRLTDAELRHLWRCAGGRFHGPTVEHATMPEDIWLHLMHRMVALAPLPCLSDVVCRIDGQLLHSGAGAYQSAVVVSVDPFVLVSLGGDMLWNATVERRHFCPLRKATTDEAQAAFGRWEREAGDTQA